MPFDGITMHAAVRQINDVVTGSRITKIYQPSKHEVLFHLRGKKDESKIIVSVHPLNCRVHLTKNTGENPAAPPMFCMLLRKYLTGGKIRNISQSGLERLVEITIENNNEFMQAVEMKLYIEVMGKHSNMVLVDSGGTIIDCIKRITSEVNRFRQVLPGEKYVLPPLGNKINMLIVDRNIIMSAFDLSVNNDASQTVSKWIVENFAGVSGAAAREILYRAGITDSRALGRIGQNELDSLIKIILDLARDISSGNFQPAVYFDNGTGNPEDFWVFPMFHKGRKAIRIPGTSDAIDFYYDKKTAAETLEHLKDRACAEISKHRKKADQNLFHIKKTLERSEEMEKYRLWGEILYANLHRIKPGACEARLPNIYHPGEEIVIPLNEKYTPAHNAQIYFNRYKKLHSARVSSESRMQEALNEMDYLENVLMNIKNSETQSDMNDIYHELESQGYIKTTAKNKMGGPASEPLKFKSSDGYTIYVGKNNRQNDTLTLKKAKPGDVWLHTKDIPGSHVVIDCNGKEVTEKTLMEAGILAAYYSKARSGSNVPVDYTLKKYVRKPSGAKPGFVIYDHQKTMYVTPEKETADRLKIIF